MTEFEFTFPASPSVGQLRFAASELGKALSTDALCVCMSVGLDAPMHCGSFSIVKQVLPVKVCVLAIVLAVFADAVDPTLFVDPTAVIFVLDDFFVTCTGVQGETGLLQLLLRFWNDLPVVTDLGVPGMETGDVNGGGDPGGGPRL